MSINSQDFGAGHLGGVDTVIWDRTILENGDYKRVGTIDKGIAKLTPNYYGDNEAMKFAKSVGAVEFIDIFEGMSKERKIELVKDKNTPIDTLKKLVEDKDKYVSEAAAKTLLLQSPNVNEDEWADFVEKVQNKNISKEQKQGI